MTYLNENDLAAQVERGKSYLSQSTNNNDKGSQYDHTCNRVDVCQDKDFKIIILVDIIANGMVIDISGKEKRSQNLTTRYKQHNSISRKTYSTFFLARIEKEMLTNILFTHIQ